MSSSKRPINNVEPASADLTALKGTIDTLQATPSYNELLQAVLSVKSLLNAMHQRPTPQAPTNTIAASSLNSVEKVRKMFKINYTMNKEHLFKLTPEAMAADLEISDWLFPLLEKLRVSSYWDLDSGSAEALCRTLVDLTLFEAMSAFDHEVSQRKLCLKAEKLLIAQRPEPNHIVQGTFSDKARATTVVPSWLSSRKHMSTFSEGLAQCLAYLVAIQQMRASIQQPQRLVTTVYGIVSDGTQWQFARLDEGLVLLLSVQLSMIDPEQAVIIMKYLHNIFAASILTTPINEIFPLSAADDDRKSRIEAAVASMTRHEQHTGYGAPPRDM